MICYKAIHKQYLYFSIYPSLTCLVLLASWLECGEFDEHGKKLFLAHTEHPVFTTLQGEKKTIPALESHA